jgi:hypothetical protein
MGISHDEKCRKYKQQIENLKMDLEDLQEKYDACIPLNHDEKRFIYTGLEMYWKQELNRDNQKFSQAKRIDLLRGKISKNLK